MGGKQKDPRRRSDCWVYLFASFFVYKCFCFFAFADVVIGISILSRLPNELTFVSVDRSGLSLICAHSSFILLLRSFFFFSFYV